jgi:osmotically-inducible protein OsmY
MAPRHRIPPRPVGASSRPAHRRCACVRAFVALALALGVSGCAGTVVGVGAVAGGAAYQERGIEGVARDFKIKARVLELWFQHEHTLGARVGLDVYEGQVLLTGVVREERMRADAVRLAWKAEEVVDVINEIEVSDGTGAEALVRDSWITTQLLAKLTFDRDVHAVNYEVETVNGVVYLIGIARDRAELDRVIAQARTIPYVRRVVDHVRVKTEL